VHVRAHSTFGRNGHDLTLRLPVTFTEAALGADVKVPTLEGQVTVRIPPGTPAGKVLRVRGHGVQADGKHKAGDLLVTVDVQVPVRLNNEQREAVAGLAKVLDEDPRAALFGTKHDRRSSDAAE
jgi:molecular chaperone DnaJ